ncbi:MAG: ferrous iron transport protein B [Phycisphaerae bacterium]|nr:ferrous iron transport protein B [Phycisphaerae bacterium]
MSGVSEMTQKTDDGSPRRRVVVALIGNPNSGKTSLFNAITGGRGHVGNWPGVTVERKVGPARRGDVRLEVVDLPGTYSLTTFSPEEIVARNFLMFERPDVVINVVDCSNLERNLYLTTQLLTLGVPLVLAFNMSDVAETSGVRIDDATLSALLGAPIVHTVGSRGRGIEELLDAAVAVAGDIPAALARQHSVDFGVELEPHVRELTAAIAQRDAQRDAGVSPACRESILPSPDGGVDLTSSTGKAHGTHNAGGTPPSRCDATCGQCKHAANLPITADPCRRHHRWLATKLLEDDADAGELLARLGVGEVDALRTEAAKARTHVERTMGRPAEMLLADRRYGFIHGACSQTVVRPDAGATVSDRIDRIVTHRWLGVPIFAAVMFVVFQMTFMLGGPLAQKLDAGKGWLAGQVRPAVGDSGAWELFRSLLADGIIEGVGAVVAFVPLIFLLYMGIAILEDSGYMARAAYVLDRTMSRVGLHGKSFIPMLIGFGCTVPGVLATRIIESRRDRLTTMLVLPLMSCGARLPVYVLLLGALFPNRTLVQLGPVPVGLQATMLFGLYGLGIVLAVACSLVLRATVFRGPATPLVMELPPYRRPAATGVVIHMWERGWEYLKKAGTVILGIVVILWAAKTWPGLPPEQLAAFEERRAAVHRSTGVPCDAGILPACPEGVSPSAGGEADVTYSINQAHGTHNAGGTPASRLAAIDAQQHRAQLEHSAVGRLGRAMEPVMAPAGMDWKVATAMLGAFAAKEVFVSQMGVVYAVGDGERTTLRQKLAADYTPLQGLAMLLMVLIASPCVATLVVTARESGSWKWAAAQWLYLTALAWLLAVGVYQVGRWIV